MTKRRKDAYEALHPETKHGTNQHTRSGQDVNSSFAEDTAEKTGVDARTIRRDAERDAERGQKINRDVLQQLLRATLKSICNPLSDGRDTFRRNRDVWGYQLREFVVKGCDSLESFSALSPRHARRKCTVASTVASV